MNTLSQGTIQTLWSVTSALRSNVETLVTTLEEDMPNLLGAALFFPDPLHQNEVNTILTCEVPKAPTFHEKFVQRHLKQRRLFLPGTALLDSLQQYLIGPYCADSRPSNMENHHHVVLLPYNLKLYGEQSFPAGLQLAFNTNSAPLPHDTEQDIVHAAVAHHDAIIRSQKNLLEALRDLQGEQTSLADPLRLNTPTQPNSFVLNWDVISSCSHAKTDYPALKNYIINMHKQSEALALSHHASYFRAEGDGAWMVFPLPDISSSKYIYDQLKTLVYDVTDALKSIHQYSTNQHWAPYHPDRSLSIRINGGLGYTEHGYDLNDTTGPVFWDVGKMAKAKNDGATTMSVDTMKVLARGPVPNRCFYPAIL